MKQAKILILISLLPLALMAQKKNTIEVKLGTYKVYNVINGYDRILSQAGLKYKRVLNNKLNGFVTYTRAPVHLVGKYQNTFVGNKYKPIADEEITTDTTAIGKLHIRNNYTYFDIGVEYGLIKYHAHSLNVGIGLSLATGINAYKTFLVLSPIRQEGWQDLVNIQYDYNREYYIGGLFSLSYDYSFCNNKINIGADFATRLYAGKKNAHLENPYPNTNVPDPNIPGGRNQLPFQINYGIHIGYNF